MKFDFSDLSTIPAINGRLATKDDFEKGLSIFYQEGLAEPFNEYRLPCLAKFTDDDGAIHKVVVIQIEKQIKLAGDGEVVCGVYFENGSSVVCTINELEFMQ